MVFFEMSPAEQALFLAWLGGLLLVLGAVAIVAGSRIARRLRCGWGAAAGLVLSVYPFAVLLYPFGGFGDGVDLGRAAEYAAAFADAERYAHGLSAGDGVVYALLFAPFGFALVCASRRPVPVCAAAFGTAVAFHLWEAVSRHFMVTPWPTFAALLGALAGAGAAWLNPRTRDRARPHTS